MNSARLNQLLAQFPKINILVVGDFFLDKYLVIDPALAETSLETGLEAHQVVAVRSSPGAAGTVAANLRALQVNVAVLGAVGNDGGGYELRRGLAERGIDTGAMLRLPDWFTPTYTKPMRRESAGAERELERLDIKNRGRLSKKVEQALIVRLQKLVLAVDGVVVVDQVYERNCGIITDAVREEITALARAHPRKIFIADSRARIGLFKGVMTKPNRQEALKAAGITDLDSAGRAVIEACAVDLYRRNQRPVFLTLGAQGILLCNKETCQIVPAAPVEGAIDVVGAGDSATAGIIASLCAGAEPQEAAWVGNLAASITIQQLGTTGQASRRQVRKRFCQIIRRGKGQAQSDTGPAPGQAR